MNIRLGRLLAVAALVIFGGPARAQTCSNASPGSCVLQDDGVFRQNPVLGSSGVAGSLTLWGGTHSVTLSASSFLSAFQINLNSAALPSAQSGTVFQLGQANSANTSLEIDAFGGTPRVTFVREDGTAAAPTAIQSGDELGSVNSFGYNGSSIVGPLAALRTYANQNWSVGANGTYIDIAVTPNGSTTLAEVIRFENDGGITVPATVTGGDKGAGTINAGGVYVNGTAAFAPTASYPTTTTINQILYSSGTNTITGLATANSSVLITSAGGVPSLATTLPSGLTAPSFTVTTAFTATGLVTNADLTTMAAFTFKGNNTSSTAAPTDLTSSQLRTAAGLDNTMFRNIIGMAGGFEVWQRGAGNSASIAVAASTTAYTADRWYITTGANQASVVSAQTGLTNGSRLAGRVQRNSAQTGTTAMTFGIPLTTEEVFRLQGQNVAISFTVSTGANWSPTSGTLLATFYVGTGAEAKRGGGFTGEVNVVASSNSLATSASAARFTAVSSGTVATTMTQGELQFTWTPTGTASTNDWFQLDDVQIEAVPSANALATAFERWSFEESLAHCRRHFWKSFVYGTAPAQSAGIATGEMWAIAGKAGAASEYMLVRYPVALRTTPTMTFYNPSAANSQMRDTQVAGDLSATATSQSSTEDILITATGNASTAVGNPLALHITADAGL